MQLRERLIAGLCLLLLGAAAEAQTVLTSNYVSIALPGSYVLGNDVFGVVISTSNVTLDLGGNAVSYMHTCNLISGGASPGCTCSATNCAGTTPGIKATGNNTVIKNGRVARQNGDGIVISSPGGSGSLNAVVKDVTVENNAGTGINITGLGAVIDNVQVYQNGHDGIAVSADARLQHVTASYNNGNGVSAAASSGNYYDVVVSYNKGVGIAANCTLDKIEAKHNGSHGMQVSGVLRDSNSELNGGDGVNSSVRGVIIDSAASQNTGNGFTLNTSTCYRNLSANGNTGTAVSGGTVLASSPGYCS